MYIPSYCAHPDLSGGILFLQGFYTTPINDQLKAQAYVFCYQLPKSVKLILLIIICTVSMC